VSDKKAFPIAVKRILAAGKVRHVDLYAGRMIRNGQGAMKFRPARATKPVGAPRRPADEGDPPASEG
jgi:hypothetical protein